MIRRLMKERNAVVRVEQTKTTQVTQISEIISEISQEISQAAWQSSLFSAVMMMMMMTTTMAMEQQGDEWYRLSSFLLTLDVPVQPKYLCSLSHQYHAKA
jgi:hypothetical protein